MTPKTLEMAIKELVGSAYHCGHNDAPSFTCPDHTKVYGYKKLIEAISTYGQQRYEDGRKHERDLIKKFTEEISK